MPQYETSLDPSHSILDTMCGWLISPLPFRQHRTLDEDRKKGNFTAVVNTSKKIERKHDGEDWWG